MTVILSDSPGDGLIDLQSHFESERKMLYLVLIGYWDDIEHEKTAIFKNKGDAEAYCNEYGFTIDKRNMRPECGNPGLYYGSIKNDRSSGLWCQLIGPVEIDEKLKD
jgi:hypothetical protein